MQEKSKLLKWALVIGIVIVLNLLFNYAISLFYKEPDYNVYFSQPQVVEQIADRDACLEVGGQWYEKSPLYMNEKLTPTPVEEKGYCDPNFTKQKEFTQAHDIYQRNVFIILVALGVLSLLLGAFLGNEIVTLGLSWGGVLSLVIASMRYWSAADNIIKVFILALALAVLIWLAFQKFGDKI